MPRISPYQVPRRRDLPLPARWVKPPLAVETTPLGQFVLLSMLLHAIFILLFGAPSGGSREGRAMWGTFQAVLLGPPREIETPLKIDRELVAPAVRAARPRPRPVEPRVTKEVERLPAPELRPDTTFSLPPLLDRIAVPERNLDLPPPLQLPPPTPPPIEHAPVEVPALPAVPTPPVERAPVEMPAVPIPSLESITPIAPTTLPALERTEPLLPPAAPPDPVPSVRTEPVPSLRPEPVEGQRPSLFKSPAPSIDSATTYDPTAPSIDLDALRNRAGQIAREGSGRRAILPFPMPPVPERKSKMETAIENARKPDCRTAYSALGLAAIVPLIANEFGEGNCRW